ncbi:MAG TPA: BppU family phage baseplate upper protein [Oscillospiraceae bacterium]|nr:BppU family phage baseplate upper protein [Oscillospiraceae bacterium]
MNEYVAKITLDLNCQATPVVISAGQYDIGRKILITLTADGEAYDATGATAVCKGKSGSNYFAVNATVAKNIVTVTADKAMLSSAGRTVAKIVLTDGTRTYSTQPFVINTHSDYDGDITTSDYYPELLDILSRVIALTESGAVLTDTALDAKSVNPVQNKVLTAIINNLVPNEEGVINTFNLADGAVTLDKLAADLAKIINNKANKATTLDGYGITDAIKNAAGTVRVVNLAYDVKRKFDEKVNSSELFDVTKSINLANLPDYSQYQNGVTITVSKNKISLSGTSTAAINAFLPLKTPIALLQANKPYCLSLQDFTTNNTGCVFYPAHGQTVIDSKWLLSEVSALKNAAATYTPTQDIVIDHIKIAIAANRLTDNSCYLQIEQNNQKTAYANPEKIVQKVKPTLYQAPDYTMHYLYVSNDYNEGTEGFGETKFNSILSANNSISDNSYHNRYTIVVMAGIYTDLQDKYAGMSDVGLVGYRGVMTKDYVYYESENIYNPSATIIKWDGATGFDKSTLKSEDIIKKCPFHLDLNVHTHIKGFTFDCKNIRYALHLESGGTGYATNWVVGHCTFIWGGRADCVDYANKTTVPVFGCGHSFGEVGLIENCKIIPTHCTIGYQNHDNADNSDFGLPIKVGAKITFKDCDFGGTEIQARTLKGAYADTPNVLTIDHCINISAINKMYAAPADHCDWDIKGVS